MKRPLKELFTSCLLLFGLVANAQSTFKVSGKILDASDEALIGATVVVKGNPSQGTIADIEGNYVLSLPAGDHTLIYTFIGYQSYEEAVSGEAGDEISISPVLSQDEQLLEEVVVIGYGTAKKQDLAGSVSAISSEDFNKGIITAPQELLQGKVSGVQISTNNGEPGAGMNVSIRGLNSLSASNQPLFVVDGIPLSGNSSPGISVDNGQFSIGSRPAQNPLSFLNPADIKSIQVLKDASATAIYGSRGSNGVVIIETKKGKSGEPKIEYSNFLSVSSVANRLDLLSGDEFREQARLIENESIIQSETGNIDWQDEVFRNALAFNHSFGISGGGDKSSYNVSLSTLKQEGTIPGNDYNRYTGKVSTSNKLYNDRWKLDISLMASRVDNTGVPIGNGGEGIITEIARANPTVESVEAYSPVEGYNPVLFLDYYREEGQTNQLLGSIGSTIDITNNLKFQSTLAVDVSNGIRVAVIDRIDASIDIGDVQNDGTVVNASSSNSSFLADNYLTYNKNFGKLDFKIMGGYSYQTFQSSSTTMTFKFIPEQLSGLFESGVIDEDYGWAFDVAYELESLSRHDEAPVPELDGSFSSFNLGAYISRVNFNWDDKYLLEANFRRDGSTKFTDENKYANFFSSAFKWKIANEAFLENISALNDFSLRMSWGQTGNQDIPAFSNVVQSYVLDGGGNLQPEYGNPFLRWETVTQTNVGLDFAFLDNKIYGNIDYFNKISSDILTRLIGQDAGLDLPLSASTVWANSDFEIITDGIEFLIGFFPVSKENFTWDFSANLTSLDMSVVTTSPILTGSISGSGVSGVNTNIFKDGDPLSFYLLDFAEFTDDGQALFYDSLGNTVTIEDARQQSIRPVFPDFTFGINSTFYIGSFDVSMSWNGAKGLYLYNNFAAFRFNRSRFNVGNNSTSQYVSREDEPINTVQGLVTSDYYLEKADYIRLNNLQVGYTFPSGKMDWLDNLRVYFTGQNLLLFTSYEGYDPEVNNNSPRDDYASYGIDKGNYPRSRTLSIGLSATF